MRENFDKALSFTLLHEGGYSFDPNDPGGETNFGISKRYHPKVDIKNLTKDQAANIYLQEYWIPMKCDDLASPLDIVVFDSAVNPGMGHVATFLKGSTSWRDVLFYRIQFYVSKESKYLQGWATRCMDLWTLARSMENGKT